MDMPGLRQPRTKRDPEKNTKNQKLYRQRKYAALNGVEDVKAVHRRRYHERMDRMRANGEYEAFKAKKTQEGMRRYHAMSEEQQSEVKRKNAQCQRNWMQKMKDKGTYEAYKQRLNTRRREIAAEKKNERWASRGGKPCRVRDTRSGWNRFGVENGNGWMRNWSVPFPSRGCPWTGPSPSLKRTQCKPFALRHYSKWTTICKNKNEFIKTCAIEQGCLFYD